MLQHQILEIKKTKLAQSTRNRRAGIIQQKIVPQV